MERTDCDTTELNVGPDDFKVSVTRYAEKTLTDKAVLIMPPTGGTNYIDRSYAKKLCRAGFDVYILNGWTGDHDNSTDLELHHRLYSRALRAVEETLKDVPKGYVGMLGTSVGATHAAVAANLNERLDAIFIIVGGAPIPSVIVSSDQGAMVKLKKIRYEKYGFKNDKEYLAAIDKVYPLDPFKTSPLFKKKILGMMISTKDTTVPVADQLALRDLWQPKLVLTRKNNHFYTIVNTWLFQQKEVVQFFTDSVKTKP